MKDYFFPHINDCIAYLYTQRKSIPPLKLQKGLYFLYAYYSAMYGHNNKTEESEVNYKFPTDLFPVEFEAWKYGAVVVSVHDTLQNNGESYYQQMAKDFDPEKFFKGENKEIQLFIDGMFGQICLSSDFALADRATDDMCFKKAKNSPNIQISNDDIKMEYKRKLGKL